ncbi:MAG TPA: thiamine pyrophosphate-dependent enzyme [Chloroflexota bacterium]|nr:thiamine pyrophosphate-dependent enzyme [Chloroflexota bacterium]
MTAVSDEPRLEQYAELVRRALGNSMAESTKPVVGNLTASDLLTAYALARVSRTMDVRERTLQAQGRAWFSIAGAGREVLGWAFARHLRTDDAKCPYYRDRTLVLACGLSPEEMFRETAGAASDPASGGRQMPSHWGARQLGVVTQSSPTGSQCLPAVGLAEGVDRATKLGLSLNEPWKPDSVVYVSLGEGTTAQGEVEEAIRHSVRTKAPVIFVVEDDKYAISIPREWSVPGADVFALYRHYADLGMLVLRCDGTDIVEADQCAAKAVDYARTRQGPVLMHALVTRPMSHSSTDTQEQYRTAEDLRDEEARDPIRRLSSLILEHRVTDEAGLEKIDDAAKQVVAAASDAAVAAPQLDPATVLEGVCAWGSSNRTAPAEPGEGEATEMRYAINMMLKAVMADDPRVVIFGEDVADAPSRDLPGKGGVFHVTRGLEFAYPGRVWNSPLAEATIVGTATGMSMAGLLPVVEVQFRDYLNPAMQQLVDEAATIRWRSDAAFTAPMVIRMAYGGYLGGAGALWHSEAGVGMLAGIPGIRVVVPSNGADAAGLLRSAVESDDVVLFLEPKALYSRKSPYPGDEYRVPFGLARVARAGSDATVICWGNLVPRSLEAAESLSGEGLNVEVIDLRTVDSGWDRETVLQSADRTGGVVIAEEDRYTAGFGASIGSRIAEELPGVVIARVAAKDCRVAYGPGGERAVLPQSGDVAAAIRRIVED